MQLRNSRKGLIKLCPQRTQIKRISRHLIKNIFELNQKIGLKVKYKT